MKELKFRAWVLNYETDKYEMYPWSPYFFSDRSPVMSYSDEFPKTDARDVILMEYTGLKDSNGEEIFEGDIVKFQGDLLRRIVVVEWLSEIKYSTGTEYQCAYFGWMGMYYGKILNQGENFARLIDSDNYKRFEVIGNVYENPELIKNYSRE